MNSSFCVVCFYAGAGGLSETTGNNWQPKFSGAGEGLEVVEEEEGAEQRRRLFTISVRN